MGFKDLFKRVSNRVDKVDTIVKNTPKVVVSATTEEIKEIKDLNLTEVDQMQGEMIASVASMALQQIGIPISVTEREVIKTAAAYVIRDIKEGSTNPEKLILMRVIHKYKEALSAKYQNK